MIFSLLNPRSNPNALWCRAVSARYVQKTLHISKLFGETFGYDTGEKRLTHAKHDFFTLLTARPESLDMSRPVWEGYIMFSEIIRFVIEHQQEDDAGNYLSRWLGRIALPNNLSLFRETWKIFSISENLILLPSLALRWVISRAKINIWVTL